MIMTNEEICRHYRLAKDKQNDIVVLADLNQTDKASIRAVLIDAGLMEPDKAAKKPVNRKELGRKIGELLAQGKTAEAIAEELGCARETVRNHKKNAKKAAAKKAAEEEPAPVSQSVSQSVSRRLSDRRSSGTSSCRCQAGWQPSSTQYPAKRRPA